VPARRRRAGLAYAAGVAFPTAVLLLLLLLGGVSLAVASLALAHVLGGWGVLFFYTLPAAVFFAWAAAELHPAGWRRVATPLRRRLRTSRLAPPPAAVAASRPPHEPVEASLGAWLLGMRKLLDVARTPRVRRLLNLGFGASAVAVLVLAGRALGRSNWPFPRTHVDLVAAAGALFLTTTLLKALGWQRLLRASERPRSLALAAGAGAASLTGLALPSRMDDAVRLSVVHRLSGRRPSVSALAVSLFALGMIDAGALAPFAIAAGVAAPVGTGTRIVLGIVAAGGVGAACSVVLVPRLRRSSRFARYGLAHRLDRCLPGSGHDAVWAWVLVTSSTACRAGGVFVLLEAVGVGHPVTLALGYVTLSAAAGALPIGPAGAATQAGIGAVMLTGAGVSARQAVAFAVAAQLLTALGGAAVAAWAALLYGLRRLRPAAALSGR
jgi:Lysylphosphatidylglycerol synthase TM region